VTLRRVSLLVLGIAWAMPGISAHEENVAQLDALIAQNPDSADLLLLRAEHRETHAEWASAEADVRRAAALEPGTARIALAFGRVAFGRGRFAEALRHFATVPGAEARVWRSRTLAQLGRQEPAHAELVTALRALDAPTPELFLECAGLTATPEAALADLDEALARLGPIVAVLERAIALELQLGRTDSALARLDALAAMAERKETWLKRRGDVLAHAGRTAEAREAYARALAAIHALPAWLRAAPDIAALAADLSRLVQPVSS
jgi:tetratricopeptide (TPR) repeat protein